MKRLLALTCACEALTGLLLIVNPALVFSLLFGPTTSTGENLVCRVAGIALISLSCASWPGRENLRALCGMLTYNALVAMYLAYVGATSRPAGTLLWPAVGLHLMMSILLGVAWLSAGTVRIRAPSDKTAENAGVAK